MNERTKRSIDRPRYGASPSRGSMTPCSGPTGRGRSTTPRSPWPSAWLPSPRGCRRSSPSASGMHFEKTKEENSHEERKLKFLRRSRGGCRRNNDHPHPLPQAFLRIVYRAFLSCRRKSLPHADLDPSPLDCCSAISMIERSVAVT